MTARFAAPLYPGGRICLRAGSVTVGAVFPPPEGGRQWEWRIWIVDGHRPTTGHAGSEMAAKNAALARWRDFLAAAQLQEAAT